MLIFNNHTHNIKKQKNSFRKKEQFQNKIRTHVILKKLKSNDLIKIN